MCQIKDEARVNNKNISEKIYTTYLITDRNLSQCLEDEIVY